ncbi:hypothetical protein E2320_007505, partial [Naja naja]
MLDISKRRVTFSSKMDLGEGSIVTFYNVSYFAIGHFIYKERPPGAFWGYFDDIVMGTLTVRENLMFSAALRLPLSMSKYEKNQRVDQVLKELDLAKVADTKPRYSIFKLFDSLTLLAAGRLLYHGPADNALPYFKSLGFVCEPYNNPADFFLDIINGDSSAVATSKMAIHSAVLEATEREQETIALTLAVQFSKCNFYKKMLEELDAMSKEQKRLGTMIKGLPYSTPFLHQLKWLSKRTFKNLIGNPQNSTAQIAIITVMGIITGAVFSGVKNDATGIQNRHEYISGYYRVSAYFFSKLIADMMPMRTLPGIILTSLNYFTIGNSLALAVATGQNITSVANLLINICFVFMIVFSGILVNLTTITPSLLWLEYFSIPRYGLNVNNIITVSLALQINEFTGLRFCNETPEGVNVTCVSTTAFTVCTGEDYLEMQGIGTTAWDLWQNHVALICMTIIFLTIAYLKLKFLKKAVSTVVIIIFFRIIEASWKATATEWAYLNGFTYRDNENIETVPKTPKIEQPVNVNFQDFFHHIINNKEAKHDFTSSQEEVEKVKYDGKYPLNLEYVSNMRHSSLLAAGYEALLKADSR